MTEGDEELRLPPEVREKFDAFDAERAEDAEKWIERLGLEGAQAESFRNHGRYWILMPDGSTPVVGMAEWSEWFHSHTEQRIIGKDDVTSPGGRIFSVSTVFLGLDHSFGMGGPPILFETMIFDHPRISKRLDRWRNNEPEPEVEPTIRYDGWQMRYATLAEAQAGHAATIRMVHEGQEDWPDGDE